MTPDPLPAPSVEIHRVGRWIYRLTLNRWLRIPGEAEPWEAGFEGPYVLGRRHAQRVAARHLRRHLRDQGWAAEPITVVRVDPRPGQLDEWRTP